MARQNAAFLSFNRGLLSPKALARVDLERTRLSAETYRNWLPKTQGAMTIRPGTKYFGSSLNDSGAEFLEFVAATDDVALPELTHQKMRIWLGADAHALALLSRPKVDTTVTLTDTGWSNTSTGGVVATSPTDVIPTMTAATTSGVTITASSQVTSESGFLGGNKSVWRAADDATATRWQDTGDAQPSTLPSWFNVDFSSDTGSRKSVRSYSVRAVDDASILGQSPNAWRLITGNFDTGTYATDTGKWTLEDERSSVTGWAVSERRSYTLPGADTGTVELRRHWRLYFTQTVVSGPLGIAEIEMFDAATAAQVKLQAGKRILNASSIGALARAEKRVIVSDTGTEHSLAITIDRGPITLRVGSTQRDDDYIRETAIGTGYHNLAFTPQGDFWVTLQHDGLIDRIVGSLAIGDSGTVEITAPWGATDLSNVRYDQSADVVYVDCDGVRPSKIERRGTGRSWSVVDYAPDNGPFLPSPSSSAKLSLSYFFGNTTLNSDIPFFTADHVGALIRAFHEGQGGQWRLGALDAKTDAVNVTGISDTGDTGTPSQQSERRLDIAVTGTYVGTLAIQRSFDGPESGFHTVSTSGGYLKGGAASDTGTFSRTVNDKDDNVKAWYRLQMTAYTSGVAVVALTYPNGGTTGIARITGRDSNTAVSVEVLSRFSDTGTTDNWQQGFWSDARGFPTAVALHRGRLAHAMGGSLFGSVSDDWENFDDSTVGDAGPLIKTLGSGPVDAIHCLISLLRLIIGTAGAELTARASTLDENLTPDNCDASTPFSTQGTANLRAVRMDGRAVYVQRSGQRLLMAGSTQTALGDYEAYDLTLLVPDLLAAGVVSIAVQRQPDTRLHCVLADGTVAILTYEPKEEVICWTTWETDTGTSGTVEKAMCLPAVGEDAVYYHIRRVINGATKRYLEKWAKESECVGDTGLCFLMDCSKSYTDTGRNAALVDIATHLVGESVVVWSDDTGSIPGVDRSPDVNGVQTRYTVDTGGDVTLTTAVHHAVAGLPFSQPIWESSKLAYAAEAGTALGQQKRVAQLALILWQCHNNGLFFGSDTGNVDPLPRVIAGAVVDADQIHATLDMVAVPFPGTHDPDARLILRGKSPRPATVLAAVPSVATNEKV